MNILITGSNGLLGQKLLTVLDKATNRLFGFDLADLSCLTDVPHEYRKIDLTDKKSTTETICEIKPQVIVHTAALTEVDRCELEKEICWNINVIGTDHIVTAAHKINANVIFISSDYIFNGKNGPYNEDDLPHPVNYYGRSKLAAENILRGGDLDWAIVRTVVLYGVGVNVKSSFVTWLLEKLRSGKSVRIVEDQWGNSTLVDDLAAGIDRIITLKRTGIYNVGNHGFMTRFEFARLIAERFDLDSRLIVPISTSSLRQPAKRPLHSGLNVEKAERELYISFKTTEEALDLYKENEELLSEKQCSR